MLLFLNVAAASLLMLAALLEERRQASRSLAESEQRFRVMADTAPVMIWRAGMDARCDFFNASWVAFTGRSIPEKPDDGWAEGAHPDDLERCLLTYRAAFAERTPFQMEYRLRRLDGDYRWLIVTGVPRFGPGGDFAGYIGSCLDITDRKQAELELQVQRQQLAHLTRVAAIGEMSAALAHELNQPLAGILANAQAAKRWLARVQPDLDEVREVRECLADIVSDNKRASEVIGRVRHLLTKTDVVTGPVALNSLAANTIRLVANNALLHSVTVDFLPAPEQPVVHGDTVQIQQVILNLLTNAIIAAANGGGSKRTVTVWTSAATAPYVELGVHDSGKGIAETDFDRIFEPFFTTKMDGLGMGLTISRTIVKAHGGRLLVENDPAGGAIFRVHLRTDQPGTSAA
jgi:PAS domain S-box-containing protein